MASAPSSADPSRVIVIGASAGGVEALTRLVHHLPADLPAVLLVVLHVPPQGTSVLADILDRAGPLPAVQAADGQPLEAGHIYVAPPDWHLLVLHGELALSRGPRENGHRPAIDPLFTSAARAYDGRTIGMVLSGTLDDGAVGLAEIKLHNGTALVQDPADALYPGMPESALSRVVPDHVGTIDELAGLLPSLARDGPPAVAMTADPPREDPEPATGDELAAADDMPQGEAVGISCPECGGALWAVGDSRTMRFRCRIGHAYSEQSLLAEHAKSVEAALWTAQRALEERAALLRRMSRRAEENGQRRTARRFSQQAGELDEKAALIRDHVVPPALAEPQAAEGT